MSISPYSATPKALESASDEEIHYLAGVLEILRGGDPVIAAGIRHVVDKRRK